MGRPYPIVPGASGYFAAAYSAGISSIICLLIFFVILPAILAAGEDGLKFRRLAPEQGLSQSSVNAIAQDRQGYLWFGTQDGLNRYDGYNFKVYRYNPADASSLSDNYIWRLLVDRQGNLWVGTYSGGLNRYDPSRDNFQSYHHDPQDSASLPSDNVSALYQDRSGTLWIGTWAGGLSRLDTAGNKFVNYLHNPKDSTSLIHHSVGAILEDTGGDLWIGTWNGLSRLRKGDRERGVFTHYRPGPGQLSHPAVWTLYEDPANPGEIWVGTYGGGICRFHKDSGKFTPFRALQANSAASAGKLITALCKDNAGNLWIGAYDEGLSRYQPAREQFDQYRNNPAVSFSLSSNEVLSLHEDRAGAIWIGTGNGLSVYDRRREDFSYHHYLGGDPRGLSDNKVRAVWEERSGGLWVGTKSSGLNYRAPGATRFQVFRHDPNNRYSLSDDRITSIYERRNGEIWVGTLDGGVNRYDRRKGRFERYQHREGQPGALSHNSIMTLCEDREGNFWIGTSGGGINRYLPLSDNFAHYASEPGSSNSLSGNWVWALYEDREGALWAGTWGRGVTRFDREKNRFTQYLHDPADSLSLSNNTVWSIMEDPRGNLWMGTWGGGLNLYDRTREQFYHLTEQDGLPNNVVYGILPDSSGSLWISTNQGLARLSWQSSGGEGVFGGNIADLKRNLQIEKYDVSDGLQGNEFNQGAFCKGKSGILYFGGINGLNAFYPERIHQNRFIPPVVITAFRVFEKPLVVYPAIARGETLTFPYTDNYFSFEYAALDYTAPRKNQYAYMLEGLNSDWIYAGTRRFVSYTHLDPGDYMFRVKGSNSDGIWNDHGAALRFRITPPFWATWWFRALLAAALGVTVYGISRYRLKRQLEIERLRIRLAADLHDEIAGNLSSIATFGKIIQNEVTSVPVSKINTLPLLERLIQLSQESVTAIRDIIWAIDSRPETLENLLLRVQDMAAGACRGGQISFCFHLPPATQLPSRNLQPEQRKDLWLLLKEVVQNAIKHAGATEISISTGYKSGMLEIVVTDNGKGFDPSRKTTGKGMSTMRGRVRRQKGQMKIDAAPGEGTKVILTLPF